MIRPDYRYFRGRSQFLIHSAKGTTWEEHKYIKRLDGTYYYPDSYEGGRHLPDGDSSKERERNPDLELEDWEKTLYKKLQGFSESEETKSKYEDFKKMLNDFSKEDFDETKLSDKDKERFKEFQKQITELSERKEEISAEEMKRMIDKIKFHYEDIKAATTLTSADVETLAQEVINGHFGTGDIQKELLGINYEKIRKRVDAILSSSVGSTPISRVTTSSSKKKSSASSGAVPSVSSSTSSAPTKTTSTVKKTKQTQASKGLNLRKVFSVYKK